MPSGPGRLMSSPLAASPLNVETSLSITALWIGFIGSILGGLPLRAIAGDLRCRWGVGVISNRIEIRQEGFVDRVGEFGDVLAQMRTPCGFHEDDLLDEQPRARPVWTDDG